MKKLLIGLVLVFLTACSSSTNLVKPSPSPVVNTNSGLPCADLVAKAFTSPDKVVAGSYECLDSNGQAEIASSKFPVSDDKGFMAYNKGEFAAFNQPPLIYYLFRGFAVDQQGDLVVVYLVGNPKTGGECLGLFVQNSIGVSVPAGLPSIQNNLIDGYQFIDRTSGLCG